MKIRCGCGSDTFKKVVKLNKLSECENETLKDFQFIFGQNEYISRPIIEEEIYYSCMNCKNIFAKKEI